MSLSKVGADLKEQEKGGSPGQAILQNAIVGKKDFSGICHFSAQEPEAGGCMAKMIHSSVTRPKSQVEPAGRSQNPPQCASLPGDMRQLAQSIHQSPQMQALSATAEMINQGAPPAQLEEGPAPAPNRTGLPDGLKSGIESLSGIAMDNVKVHYNSSQPAQLNALAYAQGSDIHVAPGEEKHLPHEAWHVVQQAQGRVQPTMQRKDGVSINDDAGLEREADMMGAKARHAESRAVQPAVPAQRATAGNRGVIPRMGPGGSIQRVRVQDSRDGSFYETEDMSDGEIEGLALQFYQLHNMSELRKIQEAHPGLPISDPELYQIAFGEPHPRTRKRHDLSEGESDNEDPTRAFRSLREDEEDPSSAGLLPPVGHDRSITARAHITAGSKAKKKSRFISGSRSKKTAGAWASKNKKARVAEFDLPPEHLDITRPSHQSQVFPEGSGSGLNAAKASQEVLVPDVVPPHYIRSIYTAEKLSVGEYERRKASGVEDQSLHRSRTKADQPPVPFALHEVYNRDQSSARWLQIAREHWDNEIASTVDQTNAQFSDDPDFTEVDADDVAEFLQERTENPHALDYIANEGEFERYLAEIDAAIEKYIRKQAKAGAARARRKK
jgi:cell fate (sporulation/competence/biofilm development) regulator YlbF (YheA/YmcA/DUF963 family)